MSRTKFSFLTIILALGACSENTEPIQEAEIPDMQEYTSLQTAWEESQAVDSLNWKWIDLPDFICRDGSSSGIGVRLNPNSEKLLIALDGGGACYNATTCGLNTSNYDKDDFVEWKEDQGQHGVFKASPNNIFQDWNVIYIPYCTGDVHAGNNLTAEVPSQNQPQKMQGAKNSELIFKLAQSSMGDKIETVMLGGSSAGGFGTVFNFPTFAKYFESQKKIALVDAGFVLLDTNLMTPCLDSLWKTTFEYNIPEDLNDVNQGQGQYAFNSQAFYEYLSRKYPETQFAITGSQYDFVLRFHYAQGQNNCQGSQAPIDTLVFKKALLELSDSLKNYPNWNIYLNNSADHSTMDKDEDFLENEVENTTPSEWLSDLVEGKAKKVLIEN